LSQKGALRASKWLAGSFDFADFAISVTVHLIAPGSPGAGAIKPCTRPSCRESAVSIVTPQPSPAQTAPIGAVALLLLACILYFLFMFPVLDNMSGGTPSASGGEGRYAPAWSRLFALLFGGSLWTVLGILLLIGGAKGEMPRWAAILAGFLFPLSGIAAGIAVAHPTRSVRGSIVVCAPACRCAHAGYARSEQKRELAISM